MYLNVGSEELPKKNIIGIFDLDTSTVSKKTRDFLARAEKEGRVTLLTYDLPRSFILTVENGEQKIYLSPVAAGTLQSRAKDEIY
jgi:hypothetical protein